MDQQTLTLTSQLITGGVALVAGLGGAGLTAYINRRNTRDTLAASKKSNEEHWVNNQEHERKSWVRSRQHEVYAEFLSIADAAFKTPDWEAPVSPSEPSAAELRTAWSKVKLVGSSEAISNSGLVLMCALNSLVQFQERRKIQLEYDADALSALQVQVALNLDKYSDLVEAFVSAVRRELGTELAPIRAPETGQG